MKLRRPALPVKLAGALAWAALTACGGGSGGDTPATASAQLSPVTDAASSVMAAASVAEAASEPASAGASAVAATVKNQAAKANVAVATSTNPATAKDAATPIVAPSTTITATPSKTVATTAAAGDAPSTAIPATASALVAAKAIVASGSTRFSPLWRLASEPAAAKKTGALTGMALLTSTSTGIFNGARTAGEDWATLIARVKTDADVASWMKNEQARVDAWISRSFERADLLGGWTPDYIDPKTNLAKAWQPTDPEPAAGTTDAEKKFKAAWVALGRDFNIAQMQAAARLYRATGNTKYADWAAKQLDFYATQYTRWPVSTAEGRSTLYKQGLDEAVALFALIDAARLLDSYAGSTRAATWRNQLFMPMATNLKSTSAPKSNIQLWHASAIATIAMRYKDTALLDYAINDPAGIKANMAAGLTADNLWIEGTFSYNTYVIECLSKLLVQASLEGYIDRFTAEADAALRMLLAPLEYRFDDGSIPNPGDSTAQPLAVFELAHWYLFRTMPTYWGVGKATAWRTWEVLLDPPAANKSASPPVIPTASTANFESLRWSVMRAGNWQAFIRYGGMLANHWSDEAFNFELRQGSTAIAVDPGTVSYGSPLHAGYFQRGPAANAPLIDGDNQLKWAPGTVTSFDASTNALQAEQAAFQADASVSRAFRLTNSGLVEQTSLKITSGKTKRLGMAFSSTCNMVPGTGVSSATGQPALPAVTAFGYWTNTATYTTTTSWQLTLKCPGDKNYLLTVWGPGAQRLYIGKAPNTPMPSTRNSLYYEVSGSAAVFESSITAL